MPLKQYRGDTVNKIVAYTAIFGKHDNLKEPKVVDENIDYYLITDRPDLYTSSVYNIVKADTPFEDQCRNAKLIKVFPELLFPDYDISIWYDGSRRVVRSLNIMIEELQDYDMLFYKHPHRDCLYDEAKICIRIRRDDPSIITEQINKYKEENFPKHYGLYACGILVRRHNLRCVKDLNNMWWKEIVTFSRRDQISFPYVLEKSEVNYVALKVCKCFSSSPHNKPRKYSTEREKNIYDPYLEKDNILKSVKNPVKKPVRKVQKNRKTKITTNRFNKPKKY